MKIVWWTNQKILEKPLFSKLVGLKFCNVRPDEIYLTPSEVHELFSSPRGDQYFWGVLLPARRGLICRG
jgi:hypothetical protein